MVKGAYELTGKCRISRVLFRKFIFKTIQRTNHHLRIVVTVHLSIRLFGEMFSMIITWYRRVSF